VAGHAEGRPAALEPRFQNGDQTRPAGSRNA